MITLKQASALIDNVVIATASIQYTRQATYYLLLANNMTSKQLTKLIIERAKVKKVSIARGCLINEIRVAQYCVDNNSIKLGDTTGKNESDLIQVIADYMTSHKLSYYFLFDKRKQAKATAESESAESESAESKQAKAPKALDLNQVIAYIKQADKQAIELIKQAIEARQADTSKASKASKASKKAA